MTGCMRSARGQRATDPNLHQDGYLRKPRAVASAVMMLRRSRSGAENWSSHLAVVSHVHVRCILARVTQVVCISAKPRPATACTRGQVQGIQVKVQSKGLFMGQQFGLTSLACKHAPQKSPPLPHDILMNKNGLGAKICDGKCLRILGCHRRLCFCRWGQKEDNACVVQGSSTLKLLLPLHLCPG